MTQRIALAEQSVTIRHAVRVSLSSLNCELIEVTTASDLLGLLRDSTVELCILNSGLPGLAAASLSEAIDESKLHILCLTDKTQTAAAALAGCQQLSIPFESQVLVESVCALLNLIIPNQDLYAPYRIEVPLAHPMVGSEKNDDGQTAEFNPISDEQESVDSSADFDESVHTDTLSDRGETKGNAGLADKTIEAVNDSKASVVVRSETYEVSPEQVIDAMADLAEFDESDSVTNPIDALSPDAPALPLRQDAQNSPPPLEIDQSQVDVPVERSIPDSDRDQDLELVSDSEPLFNQDDDSIDDQARLNLSQLPEGLADLETLRALNVSKDIVERVAWAVVPALAEAIIKEEVRKRFDSMVGGDTTA